MKLTKRGWLKPDRCIAGAGWKWNRWKHNYNILQIQLLKPTTCRMPQFFCIQGSLLRRLSNFGGPQLPCEALRGAKERYFLKSVTNPCHTSNCIHILVLIATAVNSMYLHPRRRVFWLPPAIAFPGTSSFVVGCDLMNLFWVGKWKRVYYWKSTLNTLSTKRSFQNDLQSGSILILRTFWIGPPCRNAPLDSQSSHGRQLQIHQSPSNPSGWA